MPKYANTTTRDTADEIEIASYSDPHGFLLRCMDLAGVLTLRERIDIAVKLLPFHKPKLVATAAIIDAAGRSFENWLDQLQGPGREAIDRALKLIDATPIAIDDAEDDNA